ncbi:DUF5988 family protein [Streptomyces nigra]|uniref:DUF5988 family protein n=1 Tax=Streptomyces nigra TaxID=1827580 RepID=UPI0036770417
MNDTAKVFLEGGPDVKIELRNGYEHFRPTSRRQETPQGELPVYEWWERTEMPG